MKRKLRLAFLLSLLVSIHIHAQWSAGIKLSVNANYALLNENMASCLAVSGDTIHVVWTDKRSKGSAVYYKHSLDTGVTWSTEKNITDTTGTASFAAIAVNGSTVHVVWLDSLPGHKASFYKRSLDGGNTWGTAFCLDSNTKFWPGLAASGSMVVVSLNKEIVAGNTEVYFRRSMNNGTTWDAEQQISNGPNRSEDPAIAALGSDVHLSWNDKRSDTMQIYYRHSSDAGVTWGPETQLTTMNSYTTMVSLDSCYVDVPHAISNSNFDVWIRQSSDKGASFVANKQLTTTAATEAYPFLARSRQNLHLVYIKFGTGPIYIASRDGGVTWDSAISFGPGGQPFIAITGCMLHVIWPNAGAIYYKRNPTGNPGNCSTVNTGIAEHYSYQDKVSVYPNPFSKQTTIEISATENNEETELKVYDMLGQELVSLPFGIENKISLKRDKLNSGVYFYKIIQKDKVIGSGKMFVE